MKTLRLYRHSLKNDENHISKPGLVLAGEVASRTITREVTDLFREPLIRTQQTIDGMREENPNSHYFVNAQVHEPVHELGSQEMFDQMLEPQVAGKGFRDLAAKIGNRLAVWTLHSLKMYAFYLSLMRAGVRRMFREMKGKYGVGAFHSPTVEMAAEAFGRQVPQQFPEMSYAEFQMDDDGEITVADVWVCDIKPDNVLIVIWRKRAKTTRTAPIILGAVLFLLFTLNVATQNFASCFIYEMLFCLDA